MRANGVMAPVRSDTSDPVWRRPDSPAPRPWPLHHALVLAGLDEELAPVGELDEGEWRDGAGPVGHQRSGVAGPDLPRPRAVAVEHGVGDAGAAGEGE